MKHDSNTIKDFLGQDLVLTKQYNCIAKYKKDKNEKEKAENAAIKIQSLQRGRKGREEAAEINKKWKEGLEQRKEGEAELKKHSFDVKKKLLIDLLEKYKDNTTTSGITLNNIDDDEGLNKLVDDLILMDPRNYKYDFLRKIHKEYIEKLKQQQQDNTGEDNSEEGETPKEEEEEDEDEEGEEPKEEEEEDEDEEGEEPKEEGEDEDEEGEDEENEDKGWKNFLKLEQDKSYLPVWNIEDNKEIKNSNTDNAVYVFERGYYFQGKYRGKIMTDLKYKKKKLEIEINKKQINLQNLLFDLLEKNLNEQAQKEFAEKAKKAKDNIPIAKEDVTPVVDNDKLIELEKQLANTREKLTKTIAEYKKHEELNNEKINNLNKEQQQELKQQFAKQSEDYNKALAVAKEAAEKEKEELKKEKNEYEQQAENAAKAAETSKKTIEKLNQKIESLREGDAEKKAQLEEEKRRLENEKNSVEERKSQLEKKQDEVEQKTKELHEEQINLQLLKSQHEKELEELRNLEKKQKERDEEERRKKMKEFMKHKGESLKESIESLKDEKENFTNMSEIKIAALESYPTLHDKIKKFLVFKEDELIKAHHAKFYSDNIKRNNNKLVETLKLVPSEPFLGIEGLPLVSGFGSNPEQEEKKEEEINLKVVKKKVRDFIMSKAEYIFVPSQHEQLSVKEYLKNL